MSPPGPYGRFPKRASRAPESLAERAAEALEEVRRGIYPLGTPKTPYAAPLDLALFDLEGCHREWAEETARLAELVDEQERELAGRRGE